MYYIYKYAHTGFVLGAILLACIPGEVRAQGTTADSLQQVLNTSELSETARVRTMNELAAAYLKQDPRKADSLAALALVHAQQSDALALTAESYLLHSMAQHALGDYTQALQRAWQALELFEQTKERMGIARTHHQIGVIYTYQNSYERAIEYFFKANTLFHALGDERWLADNNHQIGVLYYQQKDPNKALVYYRDALNLRQKMAAWDDMAASLTEMGRIFYDLAQYDKALLYHHRAIKLREARYDHMGIATNFRHLAYLYRQRGDFDSAQYALRRAQHFADSLQNRRERLALYLEAAKLYEQQNRIEEALAAQKAYIALKDTLFDLEKTEQIFRMQTEYQTLRQQEENELLREQNEQSTVRLKRQSVAFAIVLSALCFVGILGFLYWRNGRRMRRINRVLNRQKQEIELQTNTIELQNREILRKSGHIESSLNYAKRIQTATLPKIEDLRRVLDCFVFYKPRDIVSGDFYWYVDLKPKPVYEKMTEAHDAKPTFKGLSNSKIVLAAVDCTGHGVPGAFMSMLGEQMLEKIVVETQVTEPGLVLDMLHRDIRKTLRQEQTNNRDGMDIALCVLDTQAGKLWFAGAKNPIYYIQNNELHTLKGDKMSIGGRGEMRYATHEVLIDQPTVFYLFSDGFKDQFGGEQGRKFGPVRFRDLLLSIHKLPMEVQKQRLNDTFMQWMEQAHERQTDDVLVVGFAMHPPTA